MAHQFSYESLQEPSRQLRLLTIISVNGEITCSLETFGLDDAPDFQAVSYAWGTDTTTTSSLACNGQRLLVSASSWWHPLPASNTISCQTMD